MTGDASVVEVVYLPHLIARELVREERYSVPVATADIQEQHLVPQVLPVTGADVLLVCGFLPHPDWGQAVGVL